VTHRSAVKVIDLEGGDLWSGEAGLAPGRPKSTLHEGIEPSLDSAVAGGGTVSPLKIHVRSGDAGAMLTSGTTEGGLHEHDGSSQ
jgi:hypothetical protein